MIGDVVGDPGLTALETRLPGLVKKYVPDITVVNGENAAGGFGLSVETLDRILAAGADTVTSGNHVWEKRDFRPVLEAAARPGGRPVLRPANYFGLASVPNQSLEFAGQTQGGQMPGAPDWAPPGVGWLRIEKPGQDGPVSALVVNLQGRERMTAIDCPFRCFDRIFAEAAAASPADAADAAGPASPAKAAARSAGPAMPVIVDFHAESSEEKEALAYYLDGRAAIVAGTHTHVQTADERILPGGTAYITDLGMTGALNGVIGMDTAICLNRARTQIQFRMECARPESEADLAVEGIAVELDENGRALSIERFSV